MQFFVYMLRCRDSTFYVGQTSDLELRVAQHHAGYFGGYTAARRPLVLVFAAEVAAREQGHAVEAQLKGWSSAKKQALIRGDWRMIHALARCGARPEYMILGNPELGPL